MKTIAENPTKEQMVSGDAIMLDHQPSLCFPSHHNNEREAPQAYIANLINLIHEEEFNKLEDFGIGL